MVQGPEGTAKCQVQLIPSGQAPTAVLRWSSPLGRRWRVGREDCPGARNERSEYSSGDMRVCRAEQGCRGKREGHGGGSESLGFTEATP